MRQPGTHSLDKIQEFVAAFIRCIPGATVHPVVRTARKIAPTYEPDLILDLTLPSAAGTYAKGQSGGPVWRLAVEAVRNTPPSILDPALAMLTRYVERADQAELEAVPKRMAPLLFAPYLSPTAIGRCADAGVGCVDAVGNGRIALGTCLYIERMGRPDTAVRQEAVPNLFVPKAERVLRVLLNAAGVQHRTWHMRPLAEEASVSIGQVARVKLALLERGFIAEDSAVRRYGGFRLTEPEELLQEWAISVRSKKYRFGVDHTYNAVDSVPELKRMLHRKIRDHQGSVALSGLLAADRYASYVVSPRFTAYVVERGDIDVDLVEEALDLQPVENGINVVLTEPLDEGVLYLPEDLKAELAASPDAVRVVSPVQAYLDLQRSGGRAAEGAQHLLEAYLRPRWRRSLHSEANES